MWSVDNEMAKEKEKEKMKRRRKKKGVGRMRNVTTRRGHGDGDKVMVSGAMLMEVETVLQTQVLPLLSSFWLFSLLLSVQIFFFWFKSLSFFIADC